MASNLPNLTVQQLDYLVAVVEAPTWADAAGRLGVTPSALSQGIAELERRVGVQLFERDRRRRVLAARAAPVLEHACDVLARTRDLADWSARTRVGRAGDLRVGMIDAAAVHHYPDALRRFRNQRPDVELRLTVAPSASLLADLARGALDVVVCVKPPSHIDALTVLRVRTDELRLRAGVCLAGRAVDVGAMGDVPGGLSHARADRRRPSQARRTRRRHRRIASA